MANNWAIIIGINHYEHHPERQLKYAVPDAQLIYEFLSPQAGFDPDQILLCLGDEQYKTRPNYPTYATLLRLLNRDLHPSRIGQIDRLWFFFGGHGVSQNGRDYLLTADSLIEDIELKIALPIDEVIASLRTHQTADIVLVLDNCRQLQGSRKLSAGEVGKQTVELAHSRGITTIFSCDYGQYSYELETVQHGAFTYALVEGLKQHTLPDQLEQYLRRRVAELNQRRDQVPRIRVEPAAKALQPLLPNAVTTADITVLVSQATKAELEEDFETAKQIWWEVIEVAQSGERIQEARTAIDRIDRKIARSSGARSVSEPAKPPQPPQPLQSPQPAPLTGSKQDFSPAVSPSPAISSQPAQPSPAPVPQPTPAPTPAGAQQYANRSAVARSARRIPSVNQTSVVQTATPQQWTRQLFLKWAGLGSAGLVTAVVGHEIFKTTDPLDVSVAAPKYTQLNEKIANGLPLWKVDFETVTVDKRGRVKKRFAKQATFFKEDLGNGVILEMVQIPGGSFKMGSPETEKGRYGNESPQHTVNVPSFFMGKFAVTQAQYQVIMGNNPARFKGENHPVETIRWNDAVEFCVKLSQRTGRTYRLPSEAEWEYACRAGTITPFHFGETITSTLANYDVRTGYRSEPEGEYRRQTTKVGQFPPNAFGLYDMHGNVWEWCQDHWHANYQGAPNDGSAWLAEDKNAFRLRRGGSWSSEPRDCRSACRLSDIPVNRLSDLGFRVVCVPPRTA